MNIEFIFGILVLIIIIYYLLNTNNNQKEHLNEGTFYEIDPNVKNNLNTGLYPLCTKDIRSNSIGDRYCNDLPNFKKYTSPIYNSPSWVQTRYPSYFYPPYQTNTDEPRYMFSPDWWHSYK
jgi:hypothetical protein